MTIPVSVTYRADYDEPIEFIGTYVLSSKAELERLQRELLAARFHGNYGVSVLNLEKVSSVEDILQGIEPDTE